MSAQGDKFHEFQKKAHDYEFLRKSVDDAASVSGGLWLSYLFALFYIGLAAGGVTHKDLLLENPVKLPFLNVELQLVAFFFLAPILFVISHAYTLTHFVLLAGKVGSYHREIEKQVRKPAGLHRRGNAEADDKTSHEVRTLLRGQLPSNIFVQFLAGPRDIREGGLGWLLKAIAWISLVFGPVLLLLLIQVQFLPYHLEWVTWVQRLALLADILLLWALWPAVLDGRSVIRWPRLWRHPVATLVSLALIVLAFVVTRYPGEWMDRHVDHSRWIPPNRVTAWLGARDPENHPVATSVHDLLFNGDVDEVTRRRKSLFSNTLVLPGFDGLRAIGLDDPKKLDGDAIKHSLVLRGRHLEGAVFSHGDLRKADFEAAKLKGANLEGAQLQGALLRSADLRSARLDSVQFKAVGLDFAQLQDARLNNAHLQGASLLRTQLQGASLEGAHLEGVQLDFAQLQSASLDGAHLQGATLDHAWLPGATLEGARLQGASLFQARLQGASLKGAQLQGASLHQAQLQGASLADAHLQGASLEEVQLQGARLDKARLHGASLARASFQGASFARAQLQGADLTFSALVATDFSHAALWRVRLEGSLLTNIFEEGSEENPISGKDFDDLRAHVTAMVPESHVREEVLERIALLNPDVFGPEPDLMGVLDKGRVDEVRYKKALSNELGNLVCSGNASALFILRGLMRNRRLLDVWPPVPERIIKFFWSAGTSVSELVKKISSPSCPVSTAMTEVDKAALQNIAREAAAGRLVQ